MTYDAIGNLVGIGNTTLTWQGRELQSYGNIATYTYNVDGIRTSKTVNGVKHTYVLHGSQILSETWGDNILLYVYDELGEPVGLKYRNSTYTEGVYDCFFFEKNFLGDIIGIYNESGTKIGGYTYDAWGKCTVTATNATAGSLTYNILHNYNPFRYRGYFYDVETNLYYLQSRYYNADWGRFVSVDGVISGVGGEMLGNNPFTYCFNNPINMTDRGGNWPSWEDIKNSFKEVATAINEYIVEPVSNFFSSDTNTISGEFEEGLISGSGSLTGGYSEDNVRLQINSKDGKNNGMLGGFGKVSVGNASGKVGIGNEDMSVYVKGVADGLTATAQAGIQHKDGAGLAAKAKASVLSGRATTEFDLFGWQIELGVSGDLLSVGAEAMIGYFPNEGFTTKASVGAGLFGGGLVLRIKPPQ